MAEIDYARASNRIVQLTCFMENRIGALLQVVSLLEREKIRICAMSILESSDFGVARIVVDRPQTARSALTSSGYTVYQQEILGVALTDRNQLGIRKLLSTLLMAELQVEYVYSLLVVDDDRPILAVNCDNLEEGSRVLAEAGFDLINQDDIGSEEAR